MPEPLGEAAGNDRPIRECDVAHRLCAEPQGPEPDGRVDHALGFQGRWCTNRFSVEPELSAGRRGTPGPSGKPQETAVWEPVGREPAVEMAPNPGCGGGAAGAALQP